MCKQMFCVAAVFLLLAAIAPAAERLAFLAGSEGVRNVHIYDPATAEIKQVTNIQKGGVAGFDITPTGTLLAAAVILPDSGQNITMSLSTWDAPFEWEKLVTTFQIRNWEAVRGNYKMALSPDARHAVCVDTFGTMLVDLAKREIKYIFTHQNNPDSSVCAAYYNWGGEFSPDGKYFCLQSYCVADRLRFDIYNRASGEYRYVSELSSVTGFAWLAESDGLLLSANSCGDEAGLYIANLLPNYPLINLTECNLARSKCNKYFQDFYSDFSLPQVLDEERMLIYARAVKADGTILRDVMIVDQSKQLITKIVTGEYIEIELSPSGRYLACIAADCPSRTKGQLFIYDFQTNQGSFVRAGDYSCSHLDWFDLK